MRALFLACRQLPSHRAESRHSGISSSSYEDTIPIMGTSPSWSHLIISWRPHLLIPSHGETLRVSTYEFWGGVYAYIQSITSPKWKIQECTFLLSRFCYYSQMEKQNSNKQEIYKISWTLIPFFFWIFLHGNLKPYLKII